MGTVTDETRALARAENDVIEGEIIEVNPGSLSVPSPASGAARADLLVLLLENTTSEATRKTYAQGWRAFFGESPRLGPLWAENPREAVWQFCTWPRAERQLEAYEFRARMVAQKRAPSTIENRQSAVRQILKFAHTLGWCEDDGTGLFPRQKVQKYTDSRGIGWEKARQLMTLPAKVHAGDEDAKRLIRLRDSALISLMVQGALRNMSVRLLDVADWSPSDATVRVTEKGKAGSKRTFDLSDDLNEALEIYTRAVGNRFAPELPLFLSQHHGYKNARISANGLRYIISRYAEELGVARLYPHRLRHTAISHAAKLLKGDLLAIKDLSGHADIRTVEIYARQANSRQGEISKKLAKELKS